MNAECGVQNGPSPQPHPSPLPIRWGEGESGPQRSPQAPAFNGLRRSKVRLRRIVARQDGRLPRPRRRGGRRSWWPEFD